MLAYSVLITLNIVIILHETRYIHWLICLGIANMVIIYFPLLSLGYNSTAGTPVSYNFFEFMFNPRATLAWILMTASTFLPFKMARDLGLLIYPRYRDLLIQGGP